ncbi:hypothetical protein V502_10348 [Pseudogymnoascus sp. VKM F-4520 (FW-2644)]|nr:hypothetical protein V502_10348 [Pseudogymnoascus sp. VKM F-4520 (FW-2644)]
MASKSQRVVVITGAPRGLGLEWARQLSQDPKNFIIARMGTFQLPSGSYETLQYALDNTTHTSNKVLASQSACPKALNFHEFYAFATLRSGD